MKKRTVIPMTAAELADITRTVRGCFAELANATDGRTAGDDTICDLDDAGQEAALWIWAEHLKTGKPLRGNRGYYFAIGARRAGRLMRRLRSNTHLTDHAIDKLEMGHEDLREAVQGCGFADDELEQVPAVALPVDADRPLAGRDGARARAAVLKIVARAAEEDGLTLQQVMKRPPRLRNQVRYCREAIRRNAPAREAFRAYIGA